MPVLADLHHFYEEQDPDPDTNLHQSERSNPESLKMKGLIRIRHKDIVNIKWHCTSISVPGKSYGVCVFYLTQQNTVSAEF